MPEAAADPAAAGNGSFGQLYAAQIARSPASEAASEALSGPDPAVPPAATLADEPMSPASSPTDGEPLPSLPGLVAGLSGCVVADPGASSASEPAIAGKQLAADAPLPLTEVPEATAPVPAVLGVTLELPAETEAPTLLSQPMPMTEESADAYAPASRWPVVWVPTSVPTPDAAGAPVGLPVGSPASVRELPVAPGLLDVIALGLALSQPAEDGAFPVPGGVAAAPAIGLAQSPGDGRPGQAAPDRGSHFVALPPNPAGEPPASLVQALLIPAPAADAAADQVQIRFPARTGIQAEIQAPVPAQVPVQAEAVAWTCLPTAMPSSAGPRASISTPSATLVDVATAAGASAIADVSAPMAVQSLSVPTTQPPSAVSEGDTAQALPPAVVPPPPAARERSAVAFPPTSAGVSRSGLGTAPALVLGAAAPGAAGAPAESVRRKAPPEPIAEDGDAEQGAPAAASAATPDPGEYASVLVAAGRVADPVVAGAKVAAVDPRPLPVSVASGSPSPAAAGAQASGLRPARGRAEDPAATPPPASAAPEPATAIPFGAAMPLAGTTAAGAPAALPNPVERSIARQLSQQLAAPLATLTAHGHERKPAVDRNLVIRLTPPELGTVRVELSQRDGQVVIRMYAEDPAVRQAIERMLPSLRGDLRQGDGPAQVITVESPGSERRGERDGQRQGERSPDDRGAWQGRQQHQQRHERAYGDGRFQARSERPRFSVPGLPAAEPASVVPRPRGLGSRTPVGDADVRA